MTTSPVRASSRSRPGSPASRTSPELASVSPADRLLASAVALFAQHGYDAVSTGQIAKDAGLTQSMVHYHFGSKEKLWKAAVERIMHVRGSVFPISFADLQDLDPLAKLKVIVRRFILSNAADPQLTRILIHEGMQPTPRLRWLAKRYMLRGYQAFDSVIDEAMRAGVIRRMPVREVTNILVGAGSLSFSLAALLREVYDYDVAEPDAVQMLSDTLVQVLFRGLEAA
ncbi:MAG TPA: TetR/AcrR family transcriptional regulator [Burkholderiaceae bacterium]|nr:TetR/AcrR family transcriptional regulator [Burkholderiaceae bacterium]